MTISNMLKLITVALTLVVVSAILQDDWETYKQNYNKTYTSIEDIFRRQIWTSNMNKIHQHNELYAKGLSSYYMSENQFTDMTTEEYARMNGFGLNKQFTHREFETGKYKDVLPTNVDWRTKGYVTEVKNQGACGSCWAFSTTGSLEGQHFKASGKLVSLSESNLVDCSKKYGNHGCEGGLMDNAFKYIIANKGIDTEKSYPYKPETRKCTFKETDVGATERTYKDIESGSEDELQKAVAEIGPISVGIDASHDSFQAYSGGVYDEPKCSTTKLDHGVLVVGYGVHENKDYWLVKNSWGEDWGIKGYIMMSRNKKNQCGIATQASYPIV